MPEATGRPGEYKTPGLVCPACGHTWAVTITRSKNAPVRGTVTICLQCAEAFIFRDDSHVVPLTKEMWTLIEFTKPNLYAQLLDAISNVRGKQL
jgi:hypothetical protein